MTKEELKVMRKEKNREKAQIFRQRKKEYITSLEEKIKALEAKVWDLTSQLESYKSEPVHSCNEFDFLNEADCLNFDALNEFKTESRLSDQLSVEEVWNAQEKLMFLFNQTEIDEQKGIFRYLGKMTMCMKTQLLESDQLNVLERFMLEADMTPSRCKQIFHTPILSQLNYALKRYAEAPLASCLLKLVLKILLNS